MRGALARWRGIPFGVWMPTALAAIVVFLLRDFLFHGAYFYKRDVHLVWHPQIEAFVRAVGAGSWPVWDPSPGFGQPLLADPSSQVLYPFTWLNLVLMPWTYYTVFVACHAWFSGCGMALLARAHGLSPLAGFTAGALWITSGPFISLFDLWHHFASACWMPWVALAAYQAFDRPSLRHGILLGGAAGLQLLAGSADVAAMTGLLLAAQFLVVHTSWRREAIRDDLRRLACGVAAAALGVGIGAAVWLSAAEAASDAQRWDLPEVTRTYWSMHPLGLLDTFTPSRLSSLPLSTSWRAVLSEGREPFLVFLYLGIATWTLMLLALHGPVRSRQALVLAAVVLAALLFALGRYAPFYRAAVTVLPLLGVFRYPIKAMVLAAFAACLLAAHGLDRWRRGEGEPAPRWVLAWLVVFVLAMAGAVAAMRVAPSRIAEGLLDPKASDPGAVLARCSQRLGATAAVAAGLGALLAARRRRPGHTALLASLLAVGDLAARHHNPNPVVSRNLYEMRPEVVDIIRRTPDARVFVYDYTRKAGDAPATGPRRSKPEAPPLRRELGGPSAAQSLAQEMAVALGQQMALVPATAGRWNVDVGWSLDYRGLYPRPLAGLSWLAHDLQGEALHRLLRTGGITHVIAFHEHGFEKLTLIARVAGVWQRPLLVYTVPDTLPRTYAIARTRAAAGLDAMWGVLDDTFEPTREVILDDASAIRDRDAVGTTRLTSRRPDSVAIEANMSAPGYVVLLDAWNPGWRATVDGEPTPILRANAVFRALAVGSGRHTIEMTYRPRALLWGLALSGATTIGVTAYLLGLVVRPRGGAQA